jgi:hypothetical protein
MISAGLARIGPRGQLLLYPLLALFAFPTLGTILGGTRAWMYTLDVFDDGGGIIRLAIATREWAAHGPTLWDPYLTSGNALLGQFAISPIAPDVALAFLVGPFAAFAVMVWATAMLAGVGTHLFLRDGLHLSTPAVLAGSIIALFGFWHSIYGISVAVLPLVLWLGDRAADPRFGRTRRRYALAAVVVAALALYAGQVQVVVFVAAIQLAWIVATREPGAFAGRIRVWLLTWVLGFALYGPVLLTQLVLVGISERQVWDLRYLFGGTLPDAIRTIADHYSRLLVGVPIGSGIGPGAIRYGTIFLGGLGLPLAVLGIVAAPRRRAARFVLLLLVAIPVLDFIAILATPAQEQLGILRSFQAVRIRHFFPFALGAAAALGVEAALGAAGRIATADPIAVNTRTRRIAVGVIGLALVPVAIQLVVAGRRAIAELRTLRITHPADVGWILSAAGLAIGLAGGIGLLVLIWRHGGRRLAAPVALGAGLLLVGERILLSNGGPLLGPYIGTFDDRLGLTPGQAFLLRQPGIGSQRVMTFGDDANRMAFEGMRQADGYQAIYPLTYHGLFGAMTAPGLAADPARFRYFHSWGARAYAFRPEVDPDLVDLAGVRWLYVRDGPVPTVPGVIERYRDSEVTVYENPAAFPRAFLVGSVAVAADQAEVLAMLGAADAGTLRATAVTTTAEIDRLGPAAKALPGPGAGKLASAPGSASIVEDDPDLVAIDVHPERAAVLVLTDAWSPGWTAEIDGRPAPIAAVDGAFRGLLVDASSRRIVFRYQPGFTALGLLAAGFGIVVVAVWVRRIGRSDDTPAGDRGFGSASSATDPGTRRATLSAQSDRAGDRPGDHRA